MDVTVTGTNANLADSCLLIPTQLNNVKITVINTKAVLGRLQNMQFQGVTNDNN